MAVDMIIDLTAGGVNGESQLTGYENHIDVLAWSWGMSQSGTTHMGSGSGSGKVNVNDISFTKYIDSSSHALLQKCSKGEHIPEGVLKVRKAGGEALEYVVIELKNIIVTSISTGGSGGEDRLTENVTLNFEEFKYIYTPQEEDGSGGSEKEFAYNIAKNEQV